MIEPGLFFGLGFLAASLLALVFAPLIHARAVRLTKRRLENAGPLSAGEIQADKDRLRAEFALSTRRLELTLEQFRDKAVGQLAELGKKATAIAALKSELAEKTAEAVALSARERATAEELQAAQQALTATNEKLRETVNTLAERQAAFAKLMQQHEQRSVALDSGRIEIVALNTQVATLRDKVAELEGSLQATQAERDRARADADTRRRAVDEIQAQHDRAATRADELQAALRTKAAEAEALERRLALLEPRLAEQGEAFAATSHERDRLHHALSAARSLEAELREQLNALSSRAETDIKQLQSEKALLESQFERLREERGRLLLEVAKLRQEAEENWEIERRDTAFLRERINDVAAEVARLTSTLEGPDSPIDSLISEDTTAPFVGAGPANGAVSTARSGNGHSLADRIRMLQGRSHRAKAAS